MVDMALLDGVLRGIARRRDVISYEALSRLYYEATGEWHDRGRWEVLLSQVDASGIAAGLPPVSALVTSKPQERANFVPPAANTL